MFIDVPEHIRSQILDVLNSGDPAHMADGLRRYCETIDGIWDEAYYPTMEASLARVPDVIFLAMLDALLDQPGPVIQRLMWFVIIAVFGEFRATGTFNWETAIQMGEVNMLLHCLEGELESRLIFPLVPRNGSRTFPDNAVASIAVRVVAKLLDRHYQVIRDIPHALSSGLRFLQRSAPDSLKDLLLSWAGQCVLLGEQAILLRAALRPQSTDLAMELLLLVLDAKTSQPTPDWWCRWANMRPDIPQPATRDVLLSLVRLYTPERLRQLWQRGRERGGGHLFEAWLQELLRDPHSRNIVRGAIWALADFQEAKVQDVLAQTVTAWSRSGESHPPLCFAAIWSLSRSRDTAALQRLSDLRARVTHRTLRKKLQATLEALGAEQGLSAEELTERLAPDHGLDQQHQRTWLLGDYRATLTLAPNGRIERTIIGPGGKPRKNLPKSVRDAHSDEWRAMQTEARSLGKTLTTLKAHLENAMVDGRRWSLAAWNEVFAFHPILGHLARRLVWGLLDGTGMRLAWAIPATSGEWHEAGGAPVQLPPGAALRPAHPVDMSADEQAAWQRFIVSRQIVQPFKQVFRETYVLTPAEEQTLDVSNRFASHVVPLNRVYALTRSRGWNGRLGLSGFDGAGQGWRDFPTWNVRAHLWHGDPDGQHGIIREVWFQRRGGERPGFRAQARLRLRDVPPVAFSEAMRDVDLIVAVGSLGTDAHWQNWEQERLAARVDWEQQRAAYEQTAAATSEMRAAVLRELIPTLNLAEQIRLEGHFVLVQGQWGRYRIHLGSGNIHMEPSGRYLCIVPARRAAERLYLPFEGDDPKMAEIVSKILLLVHDDHIRDASILRQLRISI